MAAVGLAFGGLEAFFLGVVVRREQKFKRQAVERAVSDDQQTFGVFEGGFNRGDEGLVELVQGGGVELAQGTQAALGVELQPSAEAGDLIG